MRKQNICRIAVKKVCGLFARRHRVLNTLEVRKSFIFKVITVFAGLSMLLQIFYPTIALALTGGPSQPEMQGFTPIGTSNMVDLSSGSFTYNIPLMDVEGYPINLSYHSGITMDQEASWVGLGWNINPGEINRQMRGLPDDFKGDMVTQQYNLKDNITVGFNAGGGLKVFGLPFELSTSAGVFYNNYKGPGLEFGISPSICAGDPNKGCLTGSLGLNYNSQSGFDISPSIGFSHVVASIGQNNLDAGITVGTSYNSRSGLKGITMSKDLGISDRYTTTNAETGIADDGKTELNADGEFSTSSTISFSAPCYTPTISMPMKNDAITLEATVGGEIYGLHLHYKLTGYFNDQSLATHSESLPAYGYMYADQAKDNPYALYDFNREKDVPYAPHIANLPITNFTYDLFSINGQGVSGQFRPFRGDVGVLYDHENYNKSNSGTLGIEIGVGNILHLGAQLGYTHSNTVTDKWTSDNKFTSTVDFKSQDIGNIDYEPFYVKSIGEKTVNDAAYYSKIGDINTMSVKIDKSGSTVTAENIFDYGNTLLGIKSNLTKTRREKRNQSTSILSASEANIFGLNKSINSYPYNKNIYGLCSGADSITHIPRTTWPGHHMSEITVTNPDGKRYVYGIPAYNTIQKEATFAVNGTSIVDQTKPDYYNSDSVNLVSYDAGVDNSINNSKGLDHYFNEETIPEYSHSFLLTSILSPDYVDLTGDGITDDDLGEAIKINWTRVYSKSTPYRWRTPFESDDASYQIGLMSESNDDKGNYIYGEKEIWYAHSIESKTMVAQFILEDREDGFGVTGENGGIDNSRPLKCLKEINLYSKADLIKNGANAVPIKTVHFVYDYSLCQNTPNSTAGTQGKLTLKEVYFTYGNNTEGSLNSYQFTYSSYNPDYNHNRYDRWGYYKYNTPGMPPNEDFPYTIQDSAKSNLFSTAWEMTGIDLPSGGHITVQYEADQYAYVQDKRANQMFIVQGVGDGGGTYGAKLYDDGPTFHNWIYVDLPTAISSSQDFYNKYLDGINSGGAKLYFRFLVNVGDIANPHYEYVPGYADIANNGYEMINSHLGAIELSTVSSNDPWVGYANPIAIASWQFVRLNLPDVAYPGSKITGNVLSIIEGLFGIVTEVLSIFTGFDKKACILHYGKYFEPAYSYIRLDNPSYNKFGGGTRVKEIDISDDWSGMVSGQSSFTYGQTFKYTTALPGGQIISSGVATYEPLTGGDENPCRQPLSYEEKYLLAPNNQMYTETPLGESLYPAPGVVYSKVTVANLSYPGVSRTATGYTITDFYTATDFPVKVDQTGLGVQRIKPNILLSLFTLGVHDYTTASQGFSVEVNDMAGKERSEEVYDNNGALISSMEYDYKVDDPSSPSLHLNNNVQVANPDGTIGSASVGKDIDVWEDMREQDTKTFSVGVSVNNESFIFPAGFIPLFLDILALFPTYSSEHTRFRSAVTTKYIYRSGLLDKVTKMQNGSTVTTKNLLYDGETGDVLLTQTNNEFNKPVYNFTYPAHWAYDGMGSAYKNIGVELFATTNSDGTFSIPTNSVAKTYFAPGDELEYYVGQTLEATKVWVTEPVPGGSLVLVNSNGNPVILSNAIVKVIRSGRRNMAGMPIGSIVSLNSPITNDSIKINQGLSILQANGTLFDDLWKIPANKVMQQVCHAVSGPSDSLLAIFFDSLSIHKEIFAQPGDSILFGKYVHGTPDSNDLYFALTENVGYDQPSSFEAQLGDCTFSISSYSGEQIYLDSLTAFKKFTDSKGEHTVIDDTTGGCINLYYNHSTDYITYVPNYVLEGELCKKCTVCYDSCEDIAINQVFNPYAVGMMGDWRPERNYVYYDTRSPGLTASTSNIWNTGIFNHYTQLWDVPNPSEVGDIWNLDTADKNWTWTSRISIYDQKGNETEDVDALGRYSSALYGYVKSLPVAVASNAKYKDIAFDGFEDYGFTTSCGLPCDQDHFSYRDILTPGYVDTTSSVSHTGRYSLMIAANDSVTASRSINYYNGALDSATSTQYYLLNGGNIPLFSPDSGNYLLSAWVKENATCGVTGYTKDRIVVTYSGSSAQYVMKPAGPVIEGWQRFENRFKVPHSATAINVRLVAGGSNTAYYDDIRMEPFDAEMESYVYDPSSLRLMATLDENNYATLYEYNDEGILIRVKKETERGVMTIKESRSSYPRN